MLKIYDRLFNSRFLIGTARYPSLDVMLSAIKASGAEIVTVSLRRQLAANAQNNQFFQKIISTNCKILPNTAGCKSLTEVVATAEMAREIFETNWIKLEVIGDDYTLQPDPFGLVTAAEKLINLGFDVLPYCTPDLILCTKLAALGCKVLMPLASHIGTGKGIQYPDDLILLRERFPEITLIIDAGIGAPSHAARALELGYDAVLLNTAVAQANDPVLMASAFAKSIEAGAAAYRAGLMPERSSAQASTPILDTPFWHQPTSPYV